METQKVEDVNRGLYSVDGSSHPKRMHLVKGNVIKHLPRPKHNKNNMIYRIK
jgi:hypothetical protein